MRTGRVDYDDADFDVLALIDVVNADLLLGSGSTLGNRKLVGTDSHSGTKSRLSGEN